MVSAPTTVMQAPTPRQVIGFQAAHAKSTSRMTDGHTLDDVKQLHSNGQCPDTIIDGASAELQREDLGQRAESPSEISVTPKLTAVVRSLRHHSPCDREQYQLTA